MSLALLVPGAEGQLAADLLDLVRFEHNAFARGLTVEGLDVTDPFAVKDMVALWARLLRSDSPDHQLVVINAAVPADLDSGARADVDEHDAYAVEALAPALLAQACAAAGARLLHVSTAEVFAGDRDGPPYDVDDPTSPRSAYGRRLLAGEQAVHALHPDDGYVVRTARLFGGPVSETASRAAAGNGVSTGLGSPTWTRDLAAGLLALARSTAPPGTYHCAGSGEATRSEVAEVLAALSSRPPEPDRSPEPAVSAGPGSDYTVLSSCTWTEAGLPPVSAWQDALRRYVEHEGAVAP